MAQRRELLGEALSATPLASTVLSGEAGILSESMDLEVEVGTLGGPANLPCRRSEAACEGALLGTFAGKIVGWAWDRNAPLEAVDVELFIGSKKVGQGTADRFDPELLNAKIGDGCHRFEVALDSLPDTPPPFLVRAVVSGTERELEPPLTFSSLAEAEQLLEGSEYIGRVTGFVNGAICGWVLNCKNPHEQPEVTLYDGELSVLSETATRRIRATTETGTTVKAHGFSLPIPQSTADGDRHALSVRVDDRTLPGSPILFGPTDLARSLASISERIQQLDRRLDVYQPDVDHAAVEKRIAIQVLDRVDMLLNIHRDAIERELAVLRRQTGELFKILGKPDDLLSPGPIEPEHIKQPRPVNTKLLRIAPAVPLATFDLGVLPKNATATDALAWSSRDDQPGVRILGSGRILLEDLPKENVSLIIRGTGARGALDFLGLAVAYQGRLLTGRVEIDDDGEWTLSGSTSDAATGDGLTDGISFTFLADSEKPSGALTLQHVAIFGPGRAPDQETAPPPRDVVLVLGPENSRVGWYPIEAGAQGGYRWMAGHAEVVFRIRQTGRYRLTIPEMRPLVPDLLAKFQIVVSGSPVMTEIKPRDKAGTSFQLTAEFRAPAEYNDIIRLKLSFPKEHVKSPMELGLNLDERLLTVAIRTIALSAIGD